MVFHFALIFAMAAGILCAPVAPLFAAGLPLMPKESVTPVASGLYTDLCPQVRFVGAEVRDLTDLEKTMVCGAKGPTSWSQVPLNQARAFMTTFLQTRAYHHPTFKIEGDRLIVDPGQRSVVKQVEYEGVPAEIQTDRHWDLEGRPLHSATLDVIEQWMRTQLKIEGYPCAGVTLNADAAHESVVVKVSSAQKLSILGVHEELNEIGLKEGVLSRYYAFLLGRPYNLNKVNLSRTRILTSGIAQNVIFDVFCRDAGADGIYLQQSLIAGPTNLVRAGIGGNLELGPEARASWARQRLDPLGSSVEVAASVNYRKDDVNTEQARASMKQYWWRRAPRLFTQPSIKIKFQQEANFSTRDLIANYFLGYGWDGANASATLTTGPSWRTAWSHRGLADPGGGFSSTSRIIALEGHVNAMTHEYEAYLLSPRTGSQISFDVVSADPEFNSDIRAQQVQVRGHSLYNFGKFDPPRLIAGVRWALGSTLAADSTASRLPPDDFLYYLGGSTDLRGFDRKSLPLDQQGRLTSAYVGGELRWYKLLFRRLDPFLLADWGRLGVHSMRLDAETYVSYGAGLRWEAAFGVLRFFLARGEVSERAPGLEAPEPVTRLGFSFGEEF